MNRMSIFFALVISVAACGADSDGSSGDSDRLEPGDLTVSDDNPGPGDDDPDDDDPDNPGPGDDDPDDDDPEDDSCVGNFTLGETFNTGDDLGTACQPHNNPRNCLRGDYIMFPDSEECVCIVACNEFQDVGLGDSCTTDGAWTCQSIQATNASANRGEYCVPTRWGLCTSGTSDDDDDTRDDDDDTRDDDDDTRDDDDDTRDDDDDTRDDDDDDTWDDDDDDDTWDDDDDDTSDDDDDDDDECGGAGQSCSFDDDCCSDSCGWEEFGACD